MARKKLESHDEHRSSCPINLTLEILGDRWSLIVIRDMMFGDRRHFRELLNQSEEGIASNILSERLKTLVEKGMIAKRDDPSHKQKSIYSLTEASIQLVPVLAIMGNWGSQNLPATPEFSLRAKILYEGGETLCNQFMDELRRAHLSSEPVPPRPILERLQRDFMAALAARAS